MLFGAQFFSFWRGLIQQSCVCFLLYVLPPLLLSLVLILQTSLSAPSVNTSLLWEGSRDVLLEVLGFSCRVWDHKYFCRRTISLRDVWRHGVIQLFLYFFFNMFNVIFIFISFYFQSLNGGKNTCTDSVSIFILSKLLFVPDGWISTHYITLSHQPVWLSGHLCFCPTRLILVVFSITLDLTQFITRWVKLYTGKGRPQKSQINCMSIGFSNVTTAHLIGNLHH